MTITERQNPYAREVVERLKAHGVRVEVDLRNEKIGFKIREARGQKIPYMVIIGDKEMESGTIAIRKRGEDSTAGMPVETFLKQFDQEVENRS